MALDAHEVLVGEGLAAEEAVEGGGAEACVQAGRVTER